MKIKRLIIGLTVWVMASFTSTWGLQRAFGQNNSQKSVLQLSSHGDASKLGKGAIVPGVSCFKVPLASCLLKSQAQAFMSLGIVILDPRPTVSVEIGRDTAEKVITRIIDKVPGYAQNDSGGLVVIAPEKFDSPSLAALDAEIDGFYSSELDVADTIRLLAEFAESKGLPVYSEHRTTTTLLFQRAVTREDALIDIRIDAPTTLLDVLNKIVSADPPGYWVAGEWSGKLHISGEAAHTHTRKPREKYISERRHAISDKKKKKKKGE